MKSGLSTSAKWLIACVVVIAFSAIMTYEFEHSFGRIDIQAVRILDASGVTLAGKVYRPVDASAEKKMPAILNMHGYQNDKDVNAPFSIELARRGFVVLALDAIGHGDSEGGLDLGAFVTIPTNTAGWNTGYLYLKSLPFVDATNIGVMGHSLGAIATLKIGLMNPDHKAIDFVAGYAGTPALHNVLLTQARFDEFPIFREGQLRVEPLTTNPVREKAFGRTDPVEWDTTYGSFVDGSARRAALINMDHHLLPLTNKAVAEVSDWMRLSLKAGQKDAYWIDSTSQIFIWKELFGLIALLTTFFSMIPLTNMLLNTKTFQEVAQPLSTKGAVPRGRWWLFAATNAIIGGVLYPPLTSITGLNDKVEGVLPFLKLPVGNGLFLWFAVNAIVCGIFFWVSYRRGDPRSGLNLKEIGAAVSGSVLCKTLGLAVLLFAWMYILEGVSQWWLGEEFRFAWPYMRQFSEPSRFGYFLIYLIPALAFFLINGGVFMFGQIRQPESSSPTKTLWVWWVKNLFAGLTGLVIVWLVQYVPWFFFGAGPGFEEMGLPQYTSLWPLMLIVYVPEFAFLLFMLTWFYRRTGRIYLGALMISALAMWFMAAGTVISK